MNTPILTQLQPLLETKELPSLGPESRASRFSIAELSEKLATVFKASPSGAGKEQLIRSLLLLWHDHLDEAHSLAQDIHNADGSFVHGIMHRREPDYGNAKYWFHRVGQHPAYNEIAKRSAGAVRTDAEGKLLQALVRGQGWDAFGFIDTVARADTSDRPFLQRIQQVEFQVLLEHFSA